MKALHNLYSLSAAKSKEKHKFHLSAIVLVTFVDNAAVSMSAPISIQDLTFCSFECTPANGIA